jgi:hypothetical protein
MGESCIYYHKTSELGSPAVPFVRREAGWHSRLESNIIAGDTITKMEH